MTEDSARGPVGADGKTPRERLAERGYEFDEKGNTTEIGYDGRKAQGFEYFEWEWLESHRPDLELRCQASDAQRRPVVGHAWRAPDGQVWVRSLPFLFGVLREQAAQSSGNVMCSCPSHGQVLVPVAFIEDEVDSARRTASVLCTDPAPVYLRR